MIAPSAVLACLRNLMPAENFDRAQKFLEACDGLDADRMQAMAAVAFPEPWKDNHSDADAAREAILAALQSATPQGVAPASATEKTAGDYLRDSVKKIGE